MYQWVVFTHLVGLVFLAMCHGVAIFSAFRIRGLRDTAAVRDLSSWRASSRLMYIGLIVAVGGIGAASSATCGARPGSRGRSSSSSPSSSRCTPSAAATTRSVRDP